MLRKRIISITAIILISYCGLVFAVEDGFIVAKQISSDYFTILYDPEVDLPGLSDQLNISLTERILAGRTQKAAPSAEKELAEMLDTLFIRVSDILDMQLYDKFQGTIKICKTSEQLRQIYYNLLAEQLKSDYPFYIHQYNTIYISAENFTSAALG
ncbi:hypothetical protein ACFL1I_07825, partial [Candidatus Omnitrophota bacterium]